MLATTVTRMRRHLITLIITCFLQPAIGSFNLVRCCVKAARDETIMLRAYNEPWDICHFTEEDVHYPSEEQWPSVSITRTWCKAECSGYQSSKTEQWLQPLATWIAPYIAVILLCPIGEGSEEEDREEDREEGRRATQNDTEDKPKDTAQAVLDKPAPSLREKATAFLKEMFKFAKTVVGEYVLLLGDPASAIWGAFSEIISDLNLSRRLSNNSPSSFTAKALWITMLAGDTKFNNTRLLQGFWDKLKKEEPFPSHPDSSLWSSLARDIATPQRKSPSIADNDDSILKSRVGVQSSTAALPLAYASLAESLDRGVRILVRGRIDFSKGVFLPVVLTLAVAASVFFDGYQKAGDKDTAHALAYGVWYSWFITLCVAANCFATSTNVGLARKAFGKSLKLSHRRVSLAQRYTNAFKWNRWLWNIEHATNLESRTASPPVQNTSFWLRFLVGQLAGWACVAFACSCAAVISWTTPTVGLGCRSFNFVLYAIGTFCVALLHIVCERMECRRPETSTRGIRELVLLSVYWSVVIFNAAVMVVGTILHLAGVYRSCWCSRLFAGEDTLIEMNRNTELAYKNAKSYWLVTGLGLCRGEEVHYLED
ncbi:hypothetical protein CC80DRAFT_537419 [Byssothecium circinans]|uniref:Uncharacterized protein n=1 Tax=Byssothecium circinans TaxID=147558 RepID=A0A6A5TMV8_9PLEO|nr:hypothetical protein CC80DRAFT_537419 [Byssothecium circinans]